MSLTATENPGGAGKATAAAAASGSAGAIRLELFGGIRLWMAGREARLPTRKTAALLAYLAHPAGREHPREALVEAFWPESDLDSGRKSLSVALSALRRALEPRESERGSVLRTGRTTVSLHPDRLWTDASHFEALLDETGPDRASRLREAVALSAGPFLHGFYEDWAASEADRLGLRVRAALEELCDLLAESAPGEALGFAARLVDLDPLSETGYQRLMRLHGALGHRGEVLRYYRQLEAVLREELDASPSEVTRALLEELLRAPASPAPLPEVHTPFFGREAETAEIRRLAASEARLIALTGPGGVGKTRLAVEAARELQRGGRRTWFVPLAHVECGARLPVEVARAVGAEVTSDQDPLEALTLALAGVDVLVLDNLEQVLPGAEELLAQLLERLPQVLYLVTSRRVPDVPGAWEVPLPPLALPRPENGLDVETVLASESVQLFVSRSRMLRPGFTVTRENAAAVSTLCARLDGLPLALELAAARMPVLTPAQVLDQLDGAPELLADRSRRRPARHATLEATLEWSYRLLPADEQALFRRLSVFRGWSLAAAEHIWGAPVLDLLAALRASSLILAEETPAGMRYRMLETLRDFGSARLAPEERREVEQRRLHYLIELAEHTDSDDARAVEILEREQPNVWAALEWCRRSPTDAEAGLRLGGAHGWFWGLRGFADQGRYHLDGLLPLPEAQEPTLYRARALITTGFIARSHGDRDQAAAQFAEAAEIARRHGRQGMVTHALCALGLLEADRGDLAAGRIRLEECLVSMEEAGQRHGKSALLHSLARLAQMQGDLASARARLEESRALSDELGDCRCQARSRAYLASVTADEGDRAAARELMVDALRRAREVGEKTALAEFLNLAGTMALEEGRTADARPYLEEAEGLARAARSRRELARSLCALGRLATLEGRPRAAFPLHHEALRIRIRIGNSADLAESTLHAAAALTAAGVACSAPDDPQALLRTLQAS